MDCDSGRHADVADWLGSECSTAFHVKEFRNGNGPLWAVSRRFTAPRQHAIQGVSDASHDVESPATGARYDAGIRDLSERLWNGEVDTQEIHPIRAQFRDGEELSDGLLFYKGIASATTVDTGDGLVMLDTGSIADMRQLHETIRSWRADSPLRHAVFSHHHVDHIFGVGPFEEEAKERGWSAPQAIG